MEDDDAWLYGDDQPTENSVIAEVQKEPEVKKEPEENEEIVAEALEGDGEALDGDDLNQQEGGDDGVGTEGDLQKGEEEEEEEEDSDEDDIKITIDHEKIDEAKTSYQTIGLNKTVSMTARVPGMLGLPVTEKKGKFSVEEFDQIGLINGQPAQDVDLESIEDKPWKKPGADITDYFNYGFTEDTWQAYCSRQRRMRVNESGAGLPAGPGGSSHHYNRTSQINSSNLQNGKIASSNHVNSTTPSNIPTLGSTSLPLRLPLGALRTQGGPSRSVESPDRIENHIKQEPAAISVMTSDKRVYSRKVMEGIESSGGEPPTADFSLPPPGMPPPGIPPPNVMNVPPPGLPPPNAMNVPPPGLGHVPPSGPPPNLPPHPGHLPPSSADFEFSHNDDNYDDYYGGYEPTQESQWQIAPSVQDHQAPPPNSDAPPGDAGYDQQRDDSDPWENSRRPSRESPPHRTDQYPDPRMDPRHDIRYDPRPRSSEKRMAEYEVSRKRRRSRSPSPLSRSGSDRYRDYGGRDRESSRSERGRIDRDRERDRDHRHTEQKDREHERSRDRDKDRSREDDRRSERSDRERGEKRERERSERSGRSERGKDRSKSRSKSPGSSSTHKHKKSKKEKKEKSEKVEVKKEIKEEPV